MNSKFWNYIICLFFIFSLLYKNTTYLNCYHFGSIFIYMSFYYENFHINNSRKKKRRKGKYSYFFFNMDKIIYFNSGSKKSRQFLGFSKERWISCGWPGTLNYEAGIVIFFCKDYWAPFCCGPEVFSISM